MFHRVYLLAIPLGLSLLCGVPSGDSEEESTNADEPESSDVEIEEVIFARSLDEEWEPVGGAVTELRADEATITARVQIEGRPSSGTIHMRWMWRDIEVADSPMDLGDVNRGVFFSVGQSTYLRSTLTTERLYIGSGHRLVLSLGDTELGSYSFDVVPPEGARPSRFVSAEVYGAFDPDRGPSEPRLTFAPTETVHIAGQVALGHLSWFDAMVAINGEDTPALTRETIGPPDGGDVRNFAFHLAPDGGWPVGSHRIRLVLDDDDVASYDITVAVP